MSQQVTHEMRQMLQKVHGDAANTGYGTADGGYSAVDAGYRMQ